MSAHQSKWVKIFGSGPSGLLISLILFFVAHEIDKRMDPPRLIENQLILTAVFVVSLVATLSMIIWSVTSLPASERGNKLSTRGAFRYVRHPLYAAVLSIFNFGLAVHFNSYIYVLWAILLHPVWHWVIRYEERLMVDIFGETYVEYERTTGRFFPRFWDRHRWREIR